MKDINTGMELGAKGAAQPHRGDRPGVPAGYNNLSFTLCNVIRRMLDEGEVRIERAALLAGMSKRTLQRRLAQSKTEYSRLLDEIRLGRALTLVENRKLRFAEVAKALGYSDSANFVRAFRRWTGYSPSQYRAMNGESRGAVLADRLK